jgi:hypothetical protein
MIPALLLGCDGGAVTQGLAGQGVDVAVSPPNARVEVGRTVTFAAEVTGTADASVAWAVAEAGGGVVDQSGAYTAPAAPGTFHVRASSLADPTQQAVARVEVVVAGNTPDPTLLPVATTSLRWNTTAYAALGVPGLAAGQSYADPVSGATVHKITSSAFPTSNSQGCIHDYADGGNEISLPHTGQTRTVLVHVYGGSWWLVDFTPGSGVSNPRALAGAYAAFAPFMDIAFTFSNDPATPYYAYVSNGSTIRRFDVRTMTQADGGGWPVTGETNAMWLQQSVDDGLFVWMRGAGGGPIVGYQPSTGTRKVRTAADTNEPRLERDGRYVVINLNTGNNAVIWDWLADTVTGTLLGDGGRPPLPYAHIANGRGRWYSQDWNSTQPGRFGVLYPTLQGAAPNTYWSSLLGSSADVHVDGGHGCGTWVQPAAALEEQWILFSHYPGQAPSNYLAGGGPVLITETGERRLVAHHYNTSGVYERYAFAKMSPDGKFMLFTSNMNGQARTDLFLAELPAR